MLNSMAHRDFETALDRHADWGLKHLDLKGGILGEDVVSLSSEQATQAKDMIESRGLSVYCMSTTLFDEFVEVGEDAFVVNHLDLVDRAIENANILQPHFVRLLAAKTRRRSEIVDSVSYLEKELGWLLGLYREAIEKISDAGFRVTIENECHDCLFANTGEIRGFFDRLDCGEKVSLTWDVQNLWQMGIFPTLAVYEDLKPWISGCEAGDADGVLDECIALSRRVTAQRSILMSYEERLSRYTDALGIPFTPEPLP